MPEPIAAFNALRLIGMAGGCPELISNGDPEVASADRSLRHLLDAETTYRARRSIHCQIRAARLSLYRDLVGIELEQLNGNPCQIKHFAALALTELDENVVLIGDTEAGKTLPGTARDMEAVGCVRCLRWSTRRGRRRRPKRPAG